MSVREWNLTKEQHDWLNGWLELWGSWVNSGKLDKRQSNMIAKFMESVEPCKYPSRPMCNDDDGMLISQVVDSVLRIDAKAMGILLSYYAHGSSKRAIASYYHKTAKPRK
ncbi:TPA: antiterminator Q family protein, partial [Serratia fonticola]